MKNITKYIVWSMKNEWSRILNKYYIGTNHITPVKRELAIACGGFRDISLGEDKDYGYRVRKLIKT